ncbi:MAG TPA: MmgE/PrpD family protein, partial [Gammaproteobacteria bacterium]|nr:MmgE/PrpD family protein [Gammaproteobacteria bacterium]
RRYHDPDPNVKAFGARVEIEFNNGETLVDEMAVANAHSLGARPFQRDDYIGKFETLTEGIIAPEESQRFLDTVQRLPELAKEELAGLNVQVPPASMERAERDSRGIF